MADVGAQSHETTDDTPLTLESETTMTDAATPTATPAAKKATEPKPLETELTHLAEFILERTEAPSLGRHVAGHLWVIADEHDVWAANCKVSHFYDDFPCEEYERALSLGVAWMKDYIEQLETNRLEKPR